MKQNFPKNIYEALEILTGSEKALRIEKKIENFTKGIDSLNECRNEYPECEQVINNYMHAFTRSLISYLKSERPDINSYSWLELVHILLVDNKNVTKQIIEENPEFSDYLIDLVALWAEKTPTQLRGVVYDMLKD